jgi:hypothetical protein
MAALGRTACRDSLDFTAAAGALSTAIAHPRQSPPILIDLALLSLVVVCFALAMAYANLCDRLLARPADEDGGP